MVEKRSKTDIAMLVISALLTAWLSVMERVRETSTETDEAYVSKETMFWLDICSILISALLTIFGGVEVGKTEKAIKRSREAKNANEMDVEVYTNHEDEVQSTQHDEMNSVQHTDTTQINSLSADNRTINNFTIHVSNADLSQTIDILKDSPRINELYDRRLNASLSRLNTSYSNGNLTSSNRSMKRPLSARELPGFLAPRIIEDYTHSFHNDISEVSDVTFSSPRADTLSHHPISHFSNIINSIKPNINEENYSDTYNCSEDYSDEEEEELLSNEGKRSSSKSSES